MGIITFKHRYGRHEVAYDSFPKTDQFFSKALNTDYRTILDLYGKRGVQALQNATPVDSGKTAASWGYRIEEERGKLRIVFTNDNVQNGINIAIILNYGHATAHGGYVAGRDYINPAIQPIFDKIADDVWKEVIA